MSQRSILKKPLKWSPSLSLLSKSNNGSTQNFKAKQSKNKESSIKETQSWENSLEAFTEKTKRNLFEKNQNNLSEVNSIKTKKPKITQNQRNLKKEKEMRIDLDNLLASKPKTQRNEKDNMVIEKLG